MDRIIRDFVSRGVVTCRVDANAAEVARIMLDNDVSALVVIDERLNACGVISKTLQCLSVQTYTDWFG